MKKHSLFTTAALVCGMLLSTTLFAQKPTLEASLPAQLQKDLPELKANIGFLMDKVLAVNPGFKNKQQLLPNLTSALEQLKKQKPSLAAVKIPGITVSSYDELIAAKTKQLGAESGVVKILNAFKDGVNKANDDGEVITLMATLVKSPAFQTIAPADKDMFYNAFASAKAAADYGVKNNLTVMVTSPNSYRGVGGINAGKDDDEYYMKRGAGCHWLLTVAGGAIGAVAGGLGAGAGAAAGFALGANYCY